MKTKYFTIHLPAILIIFLLFFSNIQLSAALDAGWSISVPNELNFQALQWSLNEQQNIIDFTDPIIVSNSQVNTGGFILQVTSTELIEALDETLFIPYDNVEIKTGSVSTTQSDGISSPIENTYTAFSGAFSTSNSIDIMSADNRTRNAGSWSITPSLRLTIPAKQKAGSYSATITFSLI